jgi:phosphoadenosine phosphosulfate reductase
LDEKVDYSKNIIRKAIERFGDHLAIAWTGGKDSTSMLWLYREVCRELSVQLPCCMFIDEGDVFEEVMDFVNMLRKKWKIDLVVVKNTDIISKVKRLDELVRVCDLNERNQQEIAKLNFHEDAFPFEPESYICNHLMKTVAMNQFIEERGLEAISTAIRWDEQKARVQENYFSPRESPRHTRVHPMLRFKERDIWDLIHQYDIQFCSLYYQGYRSLGIKSNTKKVSDRPAWEQDLENRHERDGRGQEKEEIMSSLRSLGYM